MGIELKTNQICVSSDLSSRDERTRVVRRRLSMRRFDECQFNFDRARFSLLVCRSSTSQPVALPIVSCSLFDVST
jgi:hypothetical protein